jgi:hypothetical protein
LWLLAAIAMVIGAASAVLWVIWQSPQHAVATALAEYDADRDLVAVRPLHRYWSSPFLLTARGTAPGPRVTLTP